MTVNAITSAGQAAAAKPASQTLGQSDFIRLMTTQMKMQDPTDPVDNKEMIAQMAQFSSLSGIENINTTLKAISAQLDQALSARSSTPAV
ncbi:MAG TPA: flagellar hook capping FlgD N-terminal domain-containing protein [Novosphingobium sp.]|nr:flagellar hook capping FlgD N-terminal domain-containing protein [Novosphingobium sp.]